MTADTLVALSMVSLLSRFILNRMGFDENSIIALADMCGSGKPVSLCGLSSSFFVSVTFGSRCVAATFSGFFFRGIVVFL